MWAIAAVDSLWKILDPMDIAVLVLLLAGVAIGFWTGLIWQLICLISVITCLWVSVAYHPVVSDFLGTRLSDPVSNIGSGIGVFICALLVCYLVTFLFRGLINAIKPQFPDRILGAVFGLFVGVLVSGVLAFFVLQYANEDNSVRGYVENSKGATAMAAVVRAFVYVLPDRLRHVGDPGSDFSLVTRGPAAASLSDASTS